MATFQTKDMSDLPDDGTLRQNDSIWGSFGAGCGIPSCNCSPGFWITTRINGVVTRIQFDEEETNQLAKSASERKRPFDFDLARDEEEF